MGHRPFAQPAIGREVGEQDRLIGDGLGRGGIGIALRVT
jgi:hypothetical protein